MPLPSHPCHAWSLPSLSSDPYFCVVSDGATSSTNADDEARRPDEKTRLVRCDCTTMLDLRREAETCVLDDLQLRNHGDEWLDVGCRECVRMENTVGRMLINHNCMLK